MLFVFVQKIIFLIYSRFLNMNFLNILLNNF